MKISTFYLTNSSDYNDIVEFIGKEIDTRFYGVGFNSISVSRFISFLRKSVHTYIKLHYDKSLKVLITLPKIDEKLVIKDSKDDTIIKLKLQYDKIKNILSGEYSNYIEYITEIFDQIETEITAKNRFSFKEYLIVQMDSLSEICMNELKNSYSIRFLKNNIVKPESWVKFAKISPIFNDYYTKYLEHKDNKTLFYSFLKKLLRCF